jgi:hypothetical protein
LTFTSPQKVISVLQKHIILNGAIVVKADADIALMDSIKKQVNSKRKNK